MDEWQKEKVIKIILVIVALGLIVFIWAATLRYNLQGGFKRPSLDIHLTPTSTASGLEENIKTVQQQLSESWQLLKDILHKKIK